MARRGKIRPGPRRVPTHAQHLVRGLADVFTRLETERLVLRRVTPADSPGLSLTMDALMLTTNGWTAQHASNFLAQAATLAAHGLVSTQAAITNRTTGDILGEIGCRNVDLDRRSCEVGWWIGPAARGQGYGTEAVTAMVRALHDVGIRRIWIGTAPDNVAVRRTAATIGARLVKEARRHKLPNGIVTPSLWFAHDG
jgi:RimJ/RimL family protein N-acetyltransferase